MTRWSLRFLCLASAFLTVLSPWRARAYLVNPWTAREWASGFFTNKCHPIPKNMTLCYGIGYDQMRLPNLLNHESVDEAVQQSNIWNLLDKTKCHGDLRIFLCSLYAPVCLKEARDRQIIKPCRSLCRVVRDNCLPRMRRFGYEWPAIARCDKFPDEKRNNLCIPPREEQQKSESAVVTCRACDQAITFENIISSYCMADVVLKGKMKSHRVDPSEYLFNIHKKRRYFRTLGLLSSEKRSIGGQLKRSNGCVCPQLAKARRHDKWLIMGRRDRTTGKIDIVFLTAWQRRNRPFKKATRAIRKQANICRRQQYSFMTNNEMGLSQRPEGRKRKKGGGRRRTQESDDRFKYVDRPDTTRDSLQLLEGPTQWTPPRLSGRRNDLLARQIQDLGPAVKPLVRPRQLPKPVRQPSPPRQAPTMPQAPQRPPAVERPTQTLTAPSKVPFRPLQPTITNQQPTALSQPANQKPAGPTRPQPTRPNKRRGKGRRNRKNRKKNRDGKKRDGKKRRKKQRGNKRKGKGRKKKDRNKEGKRANEESDRERKRKRKRKKFRRNYLQQYYGVALAR